jgi:hypothetical protein
MTSTIIDGACPVFAHAQRSKARRPSPDFDKIAIRKVVGLSTRDRAMRSLIEDMCRTNKRTTLNKEMKLVQLCEHGVVRSDRIMGEIGDDVFMRVVHSRMSGCEFSMLIMIRRRFGLQLARRKTEVWMEDECITA